MRAGFVVNPEKQEESFESLKNSPIEKYYNKFDKEGVIAYIVVPNINLEAEIAEGTSDEIMDEFIGHFEETPIMSGNVRFSCS